MAFTQNAQLSGFDPSLLQGISMDQINLIGRLFNSGALKLPPSAESPSQIMSALTSTAAALSTEPTLDPHQTGPQEEDADKEEGEVDEGEVNEPVQHRGFLRPPPTGPRNRSVTPRGAPSRPTAQPTFSNQDPMRSLSHPSQPQPRANGTARAGTKEDIAKQFVHTMVKAGKSFDDLAKEVKDPKPLRRLFHQLGLPVSSPVAIEPPQPIAGAAQEFSDAAADDSRKTSAARRPPPQKAPMDRDAYLARLQALKTKKPAQDTVPAASVTQDVKEANVEEASDVPSLPSTGGYVAGSQAKAEIPAQLPPAPKAIDKTELARQRLEALKARQAAKQNGVAKSSPVPQSSAQPIQAQHSASSPPKPSLGAGIADISARFAGLRSKQPSAQPKATEQPSKPELASMEVPLQPASSAPPQPAQRTSSGGLPGLFMVGAPAQPSQTTAAPAQQIAGHVSPSQTPDDVFAIPSVQPTIPRKRAVASDFDEVAAPANAAKRPFGQSRNASEDESVIINVSDDEDEDDEMDLDDSMQLPALGVQTKSFRDVGPLRDFPPRPGFPLQSSQPSTPGGSTPGSKTYEQQLKEIEDMKRKIAEREARKKVNGKGTVPAALEAATVLKPTSPDKVNGEAGLHSPLQRSTSQNGTPAVSVDGPTSLVDLAAAPFPRAPSAGTLARQQENERLRHRLVELERNENKDVIEAVEAAARQSNQEPEPAVSGTLPGILSQDARSTNAQAAPQLQRYTEAEDLIGEREMFEDAEPSDGSMSKFYDDDDDDNIATPSMAAAQAEEDVGGPGETIEVPATQEPRAPTSRPEAEVLNDPEFENNLQPEEADQMGTPDEIQASSLDGNINIEQSSSGLVNEDLNQAQDLDDLNDLDQAGDADIAATALQPTVASQEEGEETSSVSSYESSDDEPRTGANTELDVALPEHGHAVEAAIPDVEATEYPEETEVVQDEHASESRPGADDQAGSTNEKVR
jgi:hypothetical protein